VTAAAPPRERGIVLAAAARVAAAAAARAEAHDRAGTFCFADIEALWEEGLGALSLPERLGGPGASLADTGAAVRVVARGSASTALVWVMHLSHLRMLAAAPGPLSPALRDRVLASVHAGPALVNSLRVEPELGTPARGGVPATRAVPAGDGGAPYRVSGRKLYSTGSVALRWLLVWGATGEDDPEGQRIGPFLVDGHGPGVRVEETWDHLGMRATASHDVILDAAPAWAGVLHPAGSPDTGGRVGDLAGVSTVLLLSVYLGVAHAARDWLVAHLNERAPANLGAPLATLPRFQLETGAIEARLLAVERLLDDTARRLDAGGVAAAEAAAAAPLLKPVITRELIAAVQSAVELVGNPGLSLHHPLQRHLRDVICSRIHTPQDDSVLTGAGRAALERGGTT
jgi:alkylation response protein AidB-like acyl-CoA dehydrogenase